MKKFVLRSVVIGLIGLIFAVMLPACGGGGGGGSDGEVTVVTPTGTLSTSLTDSTTDLYQAVYVTVVRVDVHHDDDGTWETVATPNKTYNLLALVNGVRETLGVATLDAGHYTQLRMLIGMAPDTGLNLFSRRHPFANYVIDQNDAVHELKTPSGTQTGLKVVNGFDVKADQTTELLLDFNAMQSVVVAGASGQYLLKPTVKVLKTEDYAIVSGLVTDNPPLTTPPTAATPLAGALVSAQVLMPAAPDAKDQVLIDAGTVSDEAGQYALFLEPKGYRLVATKEGFSPACVNVSLAAGGTAVANFSLNELSALPGTLTGIMTIAAPPGEQWATLDVRQAIECGGVPTTVTVDSVNIGDGGEYALALPAGDYTVVASTFGKTTRTATVTITSGGTTVSDITF